MGDQPQLARQRHALHRQPQQAAVQQGLRQHAPCQPHAGQHFDGLQIVGGHPQLQRQATRRKGIGHDAMGEGAGVGQHRRMGGQIAQAEACALCQWVAWGSDKMQRVVPDRRGLQRRCGGSQRGQCQLGAGVQHLVPGLLGIHEAQFQRHLRVACAELAQQRWQPVQADMVTADQTQAATNAVLELAQGAPRIVGIAQ